MALIEVEFPGGKRVDAKIGDQIIKTDQPEYAGGEGSAPAPFDLFLASIATCAGIYALGFCQSKGINTEGMSLVMGTQSNHDTHLIGKMNLKLVLPEGFPEKYKPAIIRSMDLCAVKKHMLNPPEFTVEAE